MTTIFDDLFLTKQEEEMRELSELEKSFILSPAEMLAKLRKEAIEAYEIAVLKIESLKSYEKRMQEVLK